MVNRYQVYRELKEKAEKAIRDKGLLAEGYGSETYYETLQGRPDCRDKSDVMIKCTCAGAYKECKHGHKATWFEHCRHFRFGMFCDYSGE